LDDERTRLEHIIHLEASRHRALADLAARPAAMGAYGPAARFAIGECERHGRAGEPLALVTPEGIDAAAWAAVAHRASPVGAGPFVVVDGTTSAEHDEARWQEREGSPLALADGGTLMILDAAALPLPIQDIIARSLGRRRSSEEVSSTIPPPMLMVSVHAPIARLAEQGRLSQAFTARLRASVEIPPLSARSEDLRSLVLTRLAALGMRRRGEPLGIETAALAVLLEHRFPGNDAELSDVLVRAASVATGPVVTTRDLIAIGFHQVPEPTPLPPPSVPPETRRRRSRPARSLR
jgi:DNA-binding NtrC family response regulator